MRAIDAVSLQDVWPLDNNDPQRYSNPTFMDPNIMAKDFVIEAQVEIPEGGAPRPLSHRLLDSVDALLVPRPGELAQRELLHLPRGRLR
jgi:hypothetical protein